MRKNRMMRAASALLVAVLLTTSTISGTFAKYVTQDSAEDTARVAKWGVELQVIGNLFGEDYVDAIAPDGTAAVELAVMSDTDDVDVVAPGTKNDEGFTFSINGKPEVSGRVRVETLQIQNIFLAPNDYGVMVKVKEDLINGNNIAEFFEAGKEPLYYLDGTTYKPANSTYDSNLDYYTLEDAYKVAQTYYPVIFILSGATNNNTATKNCYTDTLKGVADIIAEKFGAYGNTTTDGLTSYSFDSASVIKFNPGTTLSDLGFGAETITWAWAFDTQDNYADTILGMIETGSNVVKKSGENYVPLVEYTDYSIDIKFNLAIIVEQIDEEANA